MFIIRNNNLSINIFLLANSISISIYINILSQRIMPIFTIIVFSSRIIIIYLYTRNLKPNKIINITSKIIIIIPINIKKTIITNNTKKPQIEKIFNLIIINPNNKLILILLSITTLLIIINFMTKKNNGPLKNTNKKFN